MTASLPNLHHATLLIGKKENAEEYFYSLLESMKVKRSGNPDLWVYKSETFGIDEARELCERAGQKAFTDNKFFFVSADKYTVEAQNALLKTFEEPALSTYFFISVLEESMLLPTLLSRMQSLRLERSEEPSFDEAKAFVDMSIKERMQFVKSFADNEKNLQGFMDSLLVYLKSANEKPKLLEDVYNVGRYALDRSASARLILEHLAVTL